MIASNKLARLSLVSRGIRIARRKRFFLLGLAIFLIVGVVSPELAGNFYTKTIFDTFFIYVILAESYDLMGGLMGYINLGLTALYGAGAYAFGIEYYILHTSAVESFLIATGVVAFFGFLESFPLFRLRGFYFAVASLAIVPLGQYIAQDPSLEQWTGGIGGINGLPASYLTGYYAIFLFAVFTICLLYFISKSRFGLALTSIREDEEIAESSGINTRLIKRIVMIISATLAGCAGALFAFSQGTLLPQNIFLLSFAFIPPTFALFGGTGTIVGPILGTGVYSAIDAYVHSPSVSFNPNAAWLQNYELALVGLFLLIVGLFAPDGIIGLIRRGYLRLLKRRKKNSKKEANKRGHIALFARLSGKKPSFNHIPK
jgi:branched-chain amino acid transport system permease protein